MVSLTHDTEDVGVSAQQQMNNTCLDVSLPSNAALIAGTIRHASFILSDFCSVFIFVPIRIYLYLWL